VFGRDGDATGRPYTSYPCPRRTTQHRSPAWYHDRWFVWPRSDVRIGPVCVEKAQVCGIPPTCGTGHRRLKPASAGTATEPFSHSPLVNRLFNIAAALSAIAFCAIAGAWVFAVCADARTQFVSLSTDCHMGVHARGADARLEVFNDASYGPYSGSIIGIAGDPDGPEMSGVGDVAGFYFRMIRWPTGASLWTLSLSLAYPLAVAVVLPVVWIIRHSRCRGCRFPVNDHQAAI
jgi:hypothetical protein